ncbi:hypothetical protein ACFJIV_03435 [Mucilaginibacter sp. UC70_90]
MINNMSMPITNISNHQLALFSTELTGELKNILNYWLNHTVDDVNGGFWGKINNDNQVTPGAPQRFGLKRAHPVEFLRCL